MKLHNFNHPSSSIDVGSLTIGAFDGVHKGHLFLFQEMQKISPHQERCVVTFSPHPKEVLHPNTFAPLCNLEEKLYYLEKAGIEHCLLCSFNEDLRLFSYRDFLQKIQKKCSFSHLVLGKGSVFGNKRMGYEENILRLQEEMHFSAHYLPPLSLENGEIISSTKIREAIHQKAFHLAEMMLGRPFSLFVDRPLTIEKKKDLFYTTWPRDNRISPPTGWYSVTLIQKEIPPQEALLQIKPKTFSLFFPKKPQFADNFLFITFFEPPKTPIGTYTWLMNLLES